MTVLEGWPLWGDRAVTSTFGEVGWEGSVLRDY